MIPIKDLTDVTLAIEDTDEDDEVDEDNEADEDDEDDEEDEEDRLQLRRDFSLSTRDDGVLEIPLDVSDEKYWGVRRVRVKIQGNYQVSEFSTEVKLNIMNAKDEKEFMGKLNQFVREGKNAKIQDMFS